jgi:hypothetical protein
MRVDHDDRAVDLRYLAQARNATAERAELERARRLREALRENLRKRKAAVPISGEDEDRMLRRSDSLRGRGDAIK